MSKHSVICNCTGYGERKMIIDLSLWACQITGLNDVMRSRMNASRYALVYTHAFTHAVRSGGNGSVRVCFAPEQIVADMQMRGTFYSYFQIKRRLIACSHDYVGNSLRDIH